MNALIGYTGFVGSNILTQKKFSHLYNSSNIIKMKGCVFDEVWCAGISAVKWWANSNSEADIENISSLLTTLATVSCKHFVLISTVDIFNKPLSVDESSVPSEEGLSPYGKHRLYAEKFILDHFKKVTIVRLPGLFGNGIKKNCIYDFIHDNQVDKIETSSIFQFYGLDSIVADVETAKDAGLELIHFATEPVSMREVLDTALHSAYENHPQGSIPTNYDMRTQYAHLYGHEGTYMKSKQEVLTAIAAFAERERCLLEKQVRQ